MYCRQAICQSVGQVWLIGRPWSITRSSSCLSCRLIDLTAKAGFMNWLISTQPEEDTRQEEEEQKMEMSCG